MKHLPHTGNILMEVRRNIWKMVILVIMFLAWFDGELPGKRCEVIAILSLHIHV
jgi:hypothetical protein